MSEIVKALKQKKFYTAGKGCTEEDIINAEKALRVKFSKEYREYVLACGSASYEGHELTGIEKTPRLDVVAVTKEARELNKEVPADWYVIEDTNMDGVLIWQDSTGAVYLTGPAYITEKTADSLLEYISE